MRTAESKSFLVLFFKKELLPLRLLLSRLRTSLLSTNYIPRVPNVGFYPRASRDLVLALTGGTKSANAGYGVHAYAKIVAQLAIPGNQRRAPDVAY